VGGFFLLLNVVVSILFLRVSWFLPPVSIFFFFSVLFFKASNFNFRGKQEDSKR
jgi:hypothetical protein